MRWLERAWVIFVVSAVYSLVGFDAWWRWGPIDVSLQLAGAVAVPAVFGIFWQTLGGGNRELGLSAFVASGVWYIAALFLILAHFPPLRPAIGMPLRSEFEESLVLLCPPIIACTVCAIQSRAMARLLASRRGAAA